MIKSTIRTITSITWILEYIFVYKYNSAKTELTTPQTSENLEIYLWYD